MALLGGGAWAFPSPKRRSSSAVALRIAAQASLPSLHDAIRRDPANRALVLKAAQSDRYALLHAAQPLRCDREVVASAVSFCGDALLLSTLQGDREIVLRAVTQSGDSLRYAATEFRADREIVRAAIKQDGLALRYATDNLKDDREVVLEAVRRNGRALRHASKRLKGDLEIVCEALKQNNAAFAYIVPQARDIVYGLHADGCVWQQDFEGLSVRSEWSRASKGVIKSFTMFGAYMYAVGADDRIYKQVLVRMTLDSAWTGPLSSPDPVSWLAIGGGLIYALKKDGRIYKQVLSLMTTSTMWEGPVSDPTELQSFTLNGDKMFAVSVEGSIFEQQLAGLCNNSKWLGPLSTTMEVKAVSFHENKIYGVSNEGVIHWQILKDFRPWSEWRAASQGSVGCLTITTADLKETCEDMLESEWHALGYHLERRGLLAAAGLPTAERG